MEIAGERLKDKDFPSKLFIRCTRTPQNVKMPKFSQNYLRSFKIPI